MKSTLLWARVLSIVTLVHASLQDEHCAEMGDCQERTVLMQKTKSVSMQIDSNAELLDASLTQTPLASDSALEKEVSMGVKLMCTEFEEAQSCLCKELLISAVCSMNQQKHRWTLELSGLDANGDGALDAEEWKTSRSANLELPGVPPVTDSIGMVQIEQRPATPLADLIHSFVKATADSFDGLLEHNSCTEAMDDKRSFWDEAIFTSPSDLHDFEVLCDKGISMGSTREGTGLKDGKAFEVEGSVEDAKEDGFADTTLLETDMSHLTGLEAAMSQLTTKDIGMVRQDIDINSIKLDTDISEYVNFSRFRPISRLERIASKECAYAGVAKSVSALLAVNFCHKDVWMRKTKEVKCNSGWYQDGALCYRHCNSGYQRFGEFCYKNCPSNYNSQVGSCSREWCDGSCAWPGNWKVSNFLRDNYHSPGCGMENSRCAGCSSGYYRAALRCYQNCKSGYKCSSDAALEGHVKCRQPLPTDCLGGCASDSATCAANQFEMIQGVIDAVVTSAVLVLSFGTASSTVLAKNTMKQMAKSTAKNARRIAFRVSHKNFKDQVKKYRVDLIKKGIKDAVQGKVDEKRQKLMVDYATTEAESLTDLYLKEFEKKKTEAERIKDITKDIDPFGIVNAIDGSTGLVVDEPNKQAANWLDVASVVDPTGITGAVAGIIKHSHCEKAWESAKEEYLDPSIYSKTADLLPSNGKGGLTASQMMAIKQLQGMGYSDLDIMKMFAEAGSTGVEMLKTMGFSMGMR